MKKLLLSLLTIVYMAVSSGMAMEIHYCMGERTGTDLYASSGDTCGRCGMKEKKGGCCSDEQKFIKLSDDHKASVSHYIDPILAEVTLPSIELNNRVATLLFRSTFRTYTFADSGPPLYISNRVFRI